MELKKTPFYQKHLQNKGRIVDFSGWALPVEYRSALAEAEAVRKSCGLFDASHMGEIAIKGVGAFSFLQRLVSNDLSTIRAGQMQYNLFLNKSGCIIDDLMIYRMENSFLCVVNASNKDKVFKWLNENIQPEVEIIDKSEKYALISIQGPNAAGVIEKAFNCQEVDFEYLSFKEIEVEGEEIIISRSGYTGEDGFEIYLSWENSSKWWDRLIEKGRDFELKPCGLGSRDILRIEAGYPLYGHEIDETSHPYEASLGWAIKLSKDFIGKEELLKIKNLGTKRKRIGLIMQERAIPRQGYSVYPIGEATRVIGKISSGTYSPNIGKFIGMAYLDKECAEIGAEVSIEIRGKLYKAKIAKFPFVNIKTKGGERAKEA
ncbi:MAG: glycine cleavage system aminomethyltransferase GcvT [Candidatus Omnitrophica bacterium]|nr:glycine cleavage system aminomethyltransferase GcvT [Candidatus Omnitrophota bacterium]